MQVHPDDRKRLNLPPATVKEFDPRTLRPAPGNREVMLEDVIQSGLLDNVRASGQLDPGLVCDGVIVKGHHRAKCCEILNIPFLAVEVPAGLTEADIIALRLTEDCLRRGMSPFQQAADVEKYLKLTGSTQEEAGQRLGMKPSQVSKRLTLYRQAVPAVREAVESGAVGVSIGEIIAKLPPEKQVELLERAVKGQLKRDVVDRLAKSLRGERVRRPKEFRWNGGPGLIRVPGNWTPQQLRDWMAERMKAVDHAVKHNLPLEMLK